ncbi:Mis12-Mtw1 protein family-domain-containing protein [Lipomyces tetrasporus]|uniref:Mis12-Mtw1 protein family-domain-containing protein n=1 Tax=Lipomyces tetrasporus TaxID=54092 RepID=A0AAD7QRK1_9ASCO|nr:Mis12-Mtw1 protein family-domain-containing protein [Lipomyces tetrasporus]KAJ8100100.1 Mis12-Mtw1 protein family-domain-containing protein [Lipomyces tetrasporus]
MPSRHASVATVTVPPVGGSTLTASINLSNAMRPPSTTRLGRKRKAGEASNGEQAGVEEALAVRREKENAGGRASGAAPDTARRRRAAAVAAETKILESSRKNKKGRKAPAEDDDGFVFTRVRNIPPPLPPPDASPVAATNGITKRNATQASSIATFNNANLLRKPFSFEDESPILGASKPSPPPSHLSTKKAFNLDSTQSFSEESQTTVVSLPLTDTPMIRRNQQLRQHAPNGRRSSLGLRGKRASSLSSGLVAVPHADISSEDFYKHLDSDLPDPHRMKQLLTWCAHRSMETKDLAKERWAHSPAAAIARVIEEQLLRDLTDGKISTSWWNRPDDEDRLKKPNPQNIANLAKIDEFKKRLERLRAEKKAWAEVEADIKPIVPPSSNIDVSLLLPKEAAFLSRQAGMTTDESQPSAEAIALAAKDVELHLDSLRHSMHRVQALSAAAEKYADQVLRDVASAMAKTEQKARTIAGTEGVGMREILQTLTKVDRL